MLLDSERRRPTTPTSPSRSTASPVPSSSKRTLLRLTAAMETEQGKLAGAVGVGTPGAFAAAVEGTVGGRGFGGWPP